MNKITTLIASLLICFIASIHAQEIKIMSYNMQQPYNTNWDSRVANVANIINTHQPDILGSQELHGYMKDQIMSRISGYAAFGSGRECDGGGESSFIFYKTSKFDVDYANSGNFWFKDDYWNCGRGYDPNYNRICSYMRLKDKATGKYFYIYNSHFPTPDQYNARVSSSKLLCQIASNRAVKDPVIFTGDFNSKEGEGTPIEYIKNGSSLKMRDTYRDVNPTGSVTTGFGVRYDFIFMENQSTNKTISSYVVNSPVASDHLPIVATIKLGTTVSSNAPYGQTIWLQNSGKYVSSNNGTSAITCDRPSFDGWEKFDVIDAGNGKVALKGTNGRYISSENGTAAMNCNRESYSDWEKFDWVVVGTQVALRGNNGRYVSSENGATTGMNCNRESYSGWEIFNWGTTLKSAILSNDNDEKEISAAVYPNPCQNQLNITTPQGAATIQLFDMSGCLLLTNNIQSTNSSIDVTSLKPGLFIAKIQTIDALQTFVILKK